MSKATEDRYEACRMIDKICVMLADIVTDRTEGSGEYSDPYKTQLLSVMQALRQARGDIV